MNEVAVVEDGRPVGICEGEVDALSRQQLRSGSKRLSLSCMMRR
jgi:hypothetical protein